VKSGGAVPPHVSSWCDVEVIKQVNNFTLYLFQIYIYIYATSRKVGGSILDEVIGFSIDLIIPAALWPYEYQESSWW
jgi:hypothetical protein